MDIARFQETVWDHYRQHARDLPWRRTTDPYAILVSEIMLQQTQVQRVLPKYEQFLHAFPDLDTLATASLAEVLAVWQGLGYNRRALALHKSAAVILAFHGGRVPAHVEQLASLPGVGRATAGAISAYAFNRPSVFIETNIRAVFLYHFFPGLTGIADAQILPLVESTLDRDNPREWYYGLMDLGAFLKRSCPNPARASKHHSRQAPYEGSNRELRARLLRVLLESGAGIGLTPEELAQLIPGRPPELLENVVAALRREGFLALDGERVRVM
jgi:A/G-specific adenine glycosylase